MVYMCGQMVGMWCGDCCVHEVLLRFSLDNLVRGGKLCDLLVVSFFFSKCVEMAMSHFSVSQLHYCDLKFAGNPRISRPVSNSL
jgi:hypothetical protein